MFTIAFGILECFTATYNDLMIYMQVPEAFDTQRYQTFCYYLSYYRRNSVSQYTTVFQNSENNEITYTLSSLIPDTEYAIQVRIEVRYYHCSSFTYTSGLFSNPVTFQTNATRRYSYFNSDMFA